MAAVESERKWRFVLQLLFVIEVCIISVCAAVNDTQSEIVEWVSRRPSSDIYKFINSSSTGDNCGITFLISENKCVKDAELFRGCDHALVPARSLYLTTIVVFDTPTPNVSTYLLTGVVNGTTYNSEFKFNRTDQPVNSSFCHISSLEVYRGKEQAIEINHGGFSLSDSGNIEINTDQLGYDLEEYKGELYRMTLSCSGGGLPESGCLFFKVLGGTSVTNAKFNCTISGTLADFYEECNITTTSTILPTSIISPTVHVNTIATNTMNDIIIMTPTLSATDLEVNKVYIPLVVTMGIIIVILTISVLIMCIKKKKPDNNVSEEGREGTFQMQMDQQSQNQDCGNVEIKVNPSYGNLRQLQTQTAAFLLSGADSEDLQRKCEDADHNLLETKHNVNHMDYKVNPAYIMHAHQQKVPIYYEIEAVTESGQRRGERSDLSMSGEGDN